MKIPFVIVVAALVALPLVVLAPTASAGTCTIADPDVERVVCGAYFTAVCSAYVVADYKNVKHAATGLAECVRVMHLP